MTEVSRELVLGIETSCDETAAAVVANGRQVLSNVVASQVALHAEYGGVFPEMASRQHVRDIAPVVARAMNEAGVGFGDLAAVAVTRGPGLSGSLLVGLSAAKGISMATGLALIGVNHLEGHLYSNWLAPTESPVFPHLTLIVSGGHTMLVLVSDHGRYEVLGSTVDDAAGEAFDKAARMLELGYPGGPEIERAAAAGNAAAVDFPVADLLGRFDFSFSGLKTALLRVLEQTQGGDVPVADLAASFQWAVVRALVRGVRRALDAHAVEEVHLAGGVSANRALHEAVASATTLRVRVPAIEYCTDNAAMIAAAGYWRLILGSDAGRRFDDALALDADPSLSLSGREQLSVAASVKSGGADVL